MQFRDIITSPFPFEDNTFDFIHMRDMQSAVTVPWEKLLMEIHRVLVPGGIAHFGEFVYEHHSFADKPAVRRQFFRCAIKNFERSLQLVCPPSSSYSLRSSLFPNLFSCTLTRSCFTPCNCLLLNPISKYFCFPSLNYMSLRNASAPPYSTKAPS